MTMYPGYTTRVIEDELSWREVNELIQVELPVNSPALSMHRLQAMFAQAHGFKIQKKRMGDSELLNTLRSHGWL